MKRHLEPWAAKPWIALLAFFAVAALPPRVAAQGGSDRFVVIVHPSNPEDSLARAELERFFMKRVTTWQDGTPIDPVDLPPITPVREAWSQEVLGKRVSEVQSHWNRTIFSGRGLPPRIEENEPDAVAYVRTHRGAVAYVGPGTNLRDVKVIRITP
jgi:ABC-type phosphate transport system substrate-binding protein